MPAFILEMVKYQSTDDIVGFTLTGKRKESDYDTSFVLHDTIRVVNKKAQDAIFNHATSAILEHPGLS